MRTLDAALTAAQKLDSRPPAPKLVLTYGETEHTYSTERITIIEQLEEQFRHRATIQLDNADNYLDDYNYNGYTATIYDGLITKEGAKYSNSAPMTVISQKYESSEGRLVCVLDLRGIPDMLIDDHASDNYLPDDEDTKTVKDLIREIAGDTGVTHLSVFNHCTKYDVIFDSEDDLIDSYVPKSGFRIYDNGNRLAALKRLLDYTHCVMRFGSDGKLHILVPTTTGTTYDSEYSLAYGQHSFFSKAYRQSIVIPNYITVKSLADDDPQYSGTAKSSASYALLPKKSWVKCKLESDDQAEDIAEAIQAKYELAAEMGSAFVPMNAGQEIFDYIKVTDSRNGDARTGNIGSLRKVWKAATERRSSQYYMQFSFGGWFNTDALWKDLETFGGGIASNSGLERLSVKDLYAEKIQADSLDMVWIDPDGNVDLSKIGDTLDNLPDGENYARVKSTHIEAGDIKLTEYAVYQDGYDPSEKRRVFTSRPTVPYDVGDLWTQDGLVKRCTTAKTSAQAYSAGDWTAIDQDDIPNGSSFRRVKSTSVTTDGIVILDQVQTGTYGLVKSTDITAGHIKLSTASGSIDDIDDGTTYARLLATDISSGHIKLTSSTVVDGQWYEESGVIIDATKGIGIYGKDSAFATFASKADYTAGTYQCKMNSSGQIVAAAGKLRLGSTGMDLYDASNNKVASMYFYTNQFGFISEDNKTMYYIASGGTSGTLALAAGKTLYLGLGGWSAGSPLVYPRVELNANNLKTYATGAGSTIANILWYAQTKVDVYAANVYIGYQSGGSLSAQISVGNNTVEINTSALFRLPNTSKTTEGAIWISGGKLYFYSSSAKHEVALV